MRFTAIGTSAAYPGPNNACSGWLVQQDGLNLLIDCGTGVIARLQQILPLPDITAILISHMHADHFIDLLPLRYALKYGPNPNGAEPRLFLPPGGAQVLRDIVTPLAGDGDPLEPAFRVAEFNPDKPLQLDGLELTFAPATHYVPSWSTRLESNGARAIYTSDTGPSETVARLARGAELLITEATYQSLAEESPTQRGHMTGDEAGQLARKAGASYLVLTHHWPHRDPAVAKEQAHQTYSGKIDIAQPGAVYEI